MSDQSPQSIALFYTEGSSDKEYRVELRQVDGGWMTYGFNGRRGQALKEQKKTQEPTDFETAKKVYDATVAEKTKKGYTSDQSGAIYQSLPSDKTFSGFVPQLLNPIRDDAAIERLINDPKFIFQEKHDGERRPIRVEEATSTGINKEGVVTSLPINIVNDLATLNATAQIDGEILGERFVAFDLLEYNGENLRDQPYKDRLAKLIKVLADLPAASTIEVVHTAFDAASKRKLLNDLRNHRAEGVVIKDASAHYAPGRPASGGSQLKFKFTEVCTVRVSAPNGKKRSVAVECVDEDGSTAIALGNVTIPANFDVPAKGDIVNVSYLYLYRGGSLYQPVYQGPRQDQSTPDRLSQFKLKADVAYKVDAEDEDAPAPKTKLKV